MRFSLHPYRVPLTAPLVLKGIEHTVRQGVLVRLEDATGRVGWGDTAPLPGFSRETLGEATAQFEALQRWIEALGSPVADWANPNGTLHREIDALGLASPARFGLDLALFDLTAQAAGTSLAGAMHPDPDLTVLINALLVGPPGAVLDEASRRIAAGYTVLKLKVGRTDLDDEVVLVRTLAERFPSATLRLDANQAWTMSEAFRFAEGIAGITLDYIEEPLRNPDDLPVLWFDTRLPIALDESLEGTELEALQGKGWATAVVLKPTLLGGVARTLRFAAQARALGIRPVLSGAFESGVAMRGHVALAAATGAAPAGFDPYNRLAADVLSPRLSLDRPRIDVPSFFRAEHAVDLAEVS